MHSNLSMAINSSVLILNIQNEMWRLEFPRLSFPIEPKALDEAFMDLSEDTKSVSVDHLSAGVEGQTNIAKRSCIVVHAAAVVIAVVWVNMFQSPAHSSHMGTDTHQS